MAFDMVRSVSVSIALVVAGCSVSAPRATTRVPSRPHHASAPVRTAPAPAPAPVIALEDDPTPNGTRCERTDACTNGQQCRGPAGCEAPWACGAPRACGDTTVSYCGCDGLTFYAPDGCPGQPYVARGPCEALGEDVGGEEVEEVEGNSICTSDRDCRAGFVCAGVAGCGTYWTCVRRRTLHCSPRDQTQFCSCDGETFTANASCPGRPIAHAGPCAQEPSIQSSSESPPPPPEAEPPAPAHPPASALGSPFEYARRIARERAPR